MVCADAKPPTKTVTPFHSRFESHPSVHGEMLNTSDLTVGSRRQTHIGTTPCSQGFL
jgi:hypothetical protein